MTVSETAKASRWSGALADANLRFAGTLTLGTFVFVALVRVIYPAPVAILALGAVFGALNALIAMGIVLIYRSHRIINFAQGELGAIAGLLGVLLIATNKLPYFVALAVGLIAAVAVGALVEVAFVRRFARAPRLILTVATIGIAQLLAGGELALPSAFGQTVAPQNFPSPMNVTLHWYPVVFRGGHVLAVIVVVLVAGALGLFFRYTRAGIAVRASAESAERAAQLGIPVKRIGMFVWMLAAGLSATASLLSAPLVGLPIGQVLGPALLLRALAAGVLGRMESLPKTFAAGVGLGMIEQAVYWHTRRTVITDAVLFVVIIGALLFQKRRDAGRAAQAGVASWDLVREVRPIPRELRHLPEVRWGKAVLATVLVAAAVLWPAGLAVSRVNLLGTGLILALVGASLVILTGWAGEISLGQMALFGFGAATAAKLASSGWDFLAVIAAAGVVGAVVSVAVGLPALRIRGPFLAVATSAFALASSSYFLNSEFFSSFIVEDRIPRPVLFGRFDLENEHTFYYVLLVVLVLALASMRSVRRSRAGRVLVMTRDNPQAAQSYGINVVRARLVAFALSGFFAALAGALFAFHQHALGRSAYTPEQSIRIFSMVVFGGLGSLPGVLLGAAYFTTVDYFIHVAQFRFFISGAGLLFVLLLLPGGIGQLLYDLRDAALRRVAARRQLVVPSLVADVGRPPPDPVAAELTAAPVGAL